MGTSNQTIPFFGIDREFATYRGAILDRIETVLASGQVLQGPVVSGFENAVAAQAGRAQGVAVGSCTDALFFALIATGVQPSDEVLVPSVPM